MSTRHNPEFTTIEVGDDPRTPPYPQKKPTTHTPLNMHVIMFLYLPPFLYCRMCYIALSLTFLTFWLVSANQMYEAYSDYESMMNMAEEIVTRCAMATHGKLKIDYQVTNLYPAIYFQFTCTCSFCLELCGHACFITEKML